MNVFNSLGSNYDLRFALEALLTQDKKNYSIELIKFLEKRYGGETKLFYKGREALTFALKIIGLPKDAQIAINGFNCVAVFNAVRNAGFEPFCLDLEKDNNLNFTPDTLEKVLKNNKNIKAVVIQNSFGYPCDIDVIKKICGKYQLILVEDLAHCVGTKYENGVEAGTIGDFVIFSFSQDKVIDAVSGGALVIRNKKYQNFKEEFKLKTPKGQLKDRIYPLLTYKIRTFYNLGLGKPYHFLLKQLNLLSDPMRSDVYDLYSLPKQYCRLVLYQFNNLDKQLSHRKAISRVYIGNLNKNVLFWPITEAIKLSSNLRFPIFVKNRANLVEYLKNYNIYISDIWYNDVAPECAGAVALSHVILNLPTHINVSEKRAKFICEKINEWVKSQ